MSDKNAALHTPGPLVEKGITGDGIERKGCEVCNFIAIGPEDGPSTAYVADANDARLYRAAPDLLDASNWVLDWETTTKWLEPMPPEILADLRAAIAKAVGK